MGFLDTIGDAIAEHLKPIASHAYHGTITAHRRSTTVRALPESRRSSCSLPPPSPEQSPWVS